jgi:hypothetical protein
MGMLMITLGKHTTLHGGLSQSFLGLYFINTLLWGTVGTPLVTSSVSIDYNNMKMGIMFLCRCSWKLVQRKRYIYVHELVTIVIAISIPTYYSLQQE